MRIPYFIITTLLFIGCFDSSTEKGNPYNDDIYLLLRGPGECVQKISFDSTGVGIATQGVSKEFYQDNFASFYKIYKTDTFSVTSRVDLDFLTSEINRYRAAKKVVAGFIYDARRVQLFINGELKLDIYNNNSDKVDELLKIFFNYIKYNINEQCG
jgi:hypothetical protein